MADFLHRFVASLGLSRFALAGNSMGGGVAWRSALLTPRSLIAGSLRDAYGDPARVDDRLVDLYEDLLLRAGNHAATRERLSAPDDDGLDRRLGEVASAGEDQRVLMLK